MSSKPCDVSASMMEEYLLEHISELTKERKKVEECAADNPDEERMKSKRWRGSNSISM